MKEGRTTVPARRCVNWKEASLVMLHIVFVLMISVLGGNLMTTEASTGALP